MSYLNGKTVLPNHLLVAVQQYVEGGYIYIPKREDNHSKWGSRNNAKVKNLNRNLEILQNVSTEARSDWRQLIRLAERGGYADLALSPDNRMLYCFYEQDNLDRLSFSAFELHKNEEYRHD